MTSSAFAGVRTASSPNGATPRAPAPTPDVKSAPASGVEPARDQHPDRPRTANNGSAPATNAAPATNVAHATKVAPATNAAPGTNATPATNAAPAANGANAAPASNAARGPSHACGANPPRGANAGDPAKSGLGHVNGATVAGFDSTRFRAVLGHFATGVVAITAVDPVDGVPTGLAANSFTSVSLDPPLVAFCVAHTSTTWPTLRVARRLCVNVLGAGQLGVCQQFATKGADKFCGVDWQLSPGGAPVLDDALAWVECGIEAEYEAGDHVIVLCQVHDLGHRQGPAPLLFYRGGYGSFAG